MSSCASFILSNTTCGASLRAHAAPPNLLRQRRSAVRACAHDRQCSKVSGASGALRCAGEHTDALRQAQQHGDGSWTLCLTACRCGGLLANAVLRSHTLLSDCASLRCGPSSKAQCGMTVQLPQALISTCAALTPHTCAHSAAGCRGVRGSKLGRARVPGCVPRGLVLTHGALSGASGHAAEQGVVQHYLHPAMRGCDALRQPLCALTDAEVHHLSSALLSAFIHSLDLSTPSRVTANVRLHTIVGPTTLASSVRTTAQPAFASCWRCSSHGRVQALLDAVLVDTALPLECGARISPGRVLLYDVSLRVPALPFRAHAASEEGEGVWSVEEAELSMLQRVCDMAGAAAQVALAREDPWLILVCICVCVSPCADSGAGRDCACITAPHPGAFAAHAPRSWRGAA